MTLDFFLQRKNGSMDGIVDGKIGFGEDWTVKIYFILFIE